MENYNGWHNYATWRVNLEVWDSYEFDDEQKFDTLSDLSEWLRDMTEEWVIEGREGLIADYAQAFLNEVNYYEIAEHIAENKSLIKNL